jgi:hypothetical protein
LCGLIKQRQETLMLLCIAMALMGVVVGVGATVLYMTVFQEA